MNFTELRLRFRHWVRKYRKVIFVVFVIWGLVFLINLYMRNRKIEPVPTTTKEPHTAVIDQTSSTPKSIQTPIEDMLKEYIGYCNEGNYQKAFNMLSEDCRSYEFDNDVEKFMSHVLVKMPTPKKYSIQNYSNTTYGNKKIYIYEVKYTDDLLATGLTNTTYAYTSEKFTFYEDDNDQLQMNAGDYIYHSDIKSISENEYLKVDVVDKVVNYSIEQYEIKFTNRSNYTIVIADGVETDEVVLSLPAETRKRSETGDIVLAPQEAITLNFTFPKFVDDGDVSQAIVFSSIRVMEKYSGTEDIDEATIQSEIDNAISKFSMEVKVTE
ncbi:MAG TPA: hypothetical protein IAD08_02320 [Candidatus Scatovivens faecipullorum]|nr:hypothetical protein [Candidatus Scatovivens faecipullorum]